MKGEDDEKENQNKATEKLPSMPTALCVRLRGAGGMTRREIYLAVAAFFLMTLGTGFGLGFMWGHFVTDRDRDPALVEIMQFVDGDKFDLNAHGPVYQTTPPRVMADPAGKP